MRPPAARSHRLTACHDLRLASVRLCPAAAGRARSRPQVAVIRAELSAKGRAILPKSLASQRIMGEGSFGQVFEGKMTTPAGEQRVVMKRVKTRVQGAEEMSQMEHLLNVYASRVARGHCADFLGYCEVDDSEANPRLTAGLWLVWKYEGSKTLSYYMRRRDTVRALAQDLGVPDSAAVQTTMKHIFEGLAAFHAAGLVHRDIKPLNIIFAEDIRKFKLIDLGACADLRTGTNYVPEESILDLNYCPPEQFVMPTDSPHLAKQGLLKMAISPMLWAKHKPDRFDTWSAGMVMLQLAVPVMRTDRALRSFNAVYGPKYKYDLAAWRKATHLNARECALLDADGGAGWDLLQSLLAPRHIQVDDNGAVAFVNDSPFPRISAYEALKHKFIKSAVEAAAVQAAAPAAAAATSSRSPGGTAEQQAPAPAAARGGAAGAASSSASGSSSSGSPAVAPADAVSSALGLWRDMTGRLFDLEAKIMRQASATELQTTTVRRLKEQVEVGRADPGVLQKEEKVLSKMQNRLAGLQQDFTATANQASSGIFSFFGLGGRKQQQPEPAPSASSSGGRKSGDKGRASLEALRANAAASAAAASTSGSPSPSPTSSVDVLGPAGMFSSMWERLSSRLSTLEGKISNQASATERQSLVVRGLRAKVRAGEAEPELLNKAERTLDRMERRLLALDRDYRAAKQSASGALQGKVPDMDSPRVAPAAKRGGSGGQSAMVADASAAAQAALRSSDSDSEGGSFWSRLMGGGRKSGSGKEKAGQDTAAAAAAAPPPPPPQQQRSFSPFRNRSSSPSSQQQQQQQANPRPGSPSARSATPSSQQQSYKSIFGGIGQSKPAPPPPPPAAPPAPVEPAPQPPRATTPRSGGGGGIFSFLTGGRGWGQAPAKPEPEPEPPAVVVPPPAAPASASSGDALVEGASRVIGSSLGFAGLAAKVAADLAASIKADAERYLKEIEAQEAAKRQQRLMDTALLALLKEAQPPLSSRTLYEDADERFKEEARWQAVPEVSRRRQLFGQFLATVKKAERQQAEAAEAAYRAALRRYNVRASSRWEEFAALLPHDTDPMLAGVVDPARRQQLFVEIVAELQLQEALQAAAKKAEDEYMTMLRELDDPAPITATSTWALVRRLLLSDPRCQALPELRRRELFEAYTASLFDAEAKKAEEAAAAAEAAEAGDTAAIPFPAVAVAAPVPATPPPSPAATPAPATRAVEAAPSAAVNAGSVAATAAAAGTASASGGVPLEDEELAAALASMEAALESAIKAVASAPPPSALVAGEALRNGAAAAVSPPAPAAAGSGSSNGNSNGVGKKAGPAGGVFESSRLEELRKEQARLRAEYETMAARLREMEDRLKAQSQLVTSDDEGGAAVEAAGAQQQQGAAAEPAVASAPGSPSSNGVPKEVGRRWK